MTASLVFLAFVAVLSSPVAVAAASLLAPSLHTPRRPGAPVHVRAVLAGVAESAADSSLLGRVLSVSADGLVAIRPVDRGLARVGTALRFGGGGLGVIIAERCGLYFAGCVEGVPPSAQEAAELLPRNLTVQAWDGDAASWGGVFDYLGRPAGEQTVAPDAASPDVFAEPVSTARRRPIGASMHTGVVAIDALAPIGRGQSMMLFGPDALPAGSTRTDLAKRILIAQHALASGVRCVLALTESDAASRRATIDALAEAGVLESVRVLEATSPIEAVVAASAACSIAEACADQDVLVVVDSLRPHLHVWKAFCSCLYEANVPVSPEEEGSQQRAYYSRLVERASRRTEAAGGGSTTLLLLQPSVSVLPSSAALKEEYTLSDFESGGFSKTACARVAMLAERGIPITQDVLVKVGIPLPGSDHPAAGKGQRSQQHLEELTSLVDGHIDLRENLAAKGRVPPIDPSNSLTRIGVGSTKLRPLSSTAAMASVNSAMRLNLAAASDPGNYDAKEKARAAAYMAAMQQPTPTPLSLGEEVCLLYTASLGLLDDAVMAAGDTGCEPQLRKLLEYVQTAEPALLPKISESGLLGDAQKERLAELAAEALAS